MEVLNVILTVIGCAITAGIAGLGLYSFGSISLKELRK